MRDGLATRQAHIRGVAGRGAPLLQSLRLGGVPHRYILRSSALPGALREAGMIKSFAPCHVVGVPLRKPLQRAAVGYCRSGSGENCYHQGCGSSRRADPVTSHTTILKSLLARTIHGAPRSQPARDCVAKVASRAASRLAGRHLIRLRDFAGLIARQRPGRNDGDEGQRRHQQKPEFQCAKARLGIDPHRFGDLRR